MTIQPTRKVSNTTITCSVNQDLADPNILNRKLKMLNNLRGNGPTDDQKMTPATHKLLELMEGSQRNLFSSAYQV